MKGNSQHRVEASPEAPAVIRLLAPVVRLALVWGRWAAQHPKTAILVYALELCVGPAIWWSLFSLRAGLIVLVVELGLIATLFFWARRVRRKRGLPPLPPLWRKQTPPGGEAG